MTLESGTKDIQEAPAAAAVAAGESMRKAAHKEVASQQKLMF